MKTQSDSKVRIVSLTNLQACIDNYKAKIAGVRAVAA